MGMLTKLFKNLSGFQKATFSIVAIFFIFNLSLLVTSLLMDASDLKQMVKMARYISYMKYVVIINMVLFIVIVSLYYYENRKLRKSFNQQEDLYIKLKSTLYDIQKEKTDIV
jgi:uncharacterized membrane protein